MLSNFACCLKDKANDIKDDDDTVAGDDVDNSNQVDSITSRGLALPPGMAKPEEVTKKMKARQRKDPTQWTMSMNQWVNVLKHCFKQPEYATLKSKSGAVTMYDINECFVKEWTKETGCSVAVLMNPNPKLPAKLMLSHAWGEDAEEMLEAVEMFFDQRKIDRETPIWFCVFSNYQPGDDAGPSIAEQLELDPFASVVESKHIKKQHKGFGLLAVHTTTAELYTRLWCVHEVDRALNQDGVNVAGTFSDQYVQEKNRRVQMFLDFGVNIDEALAGAGIETETIKAKCGHAEDEKMLIAKILSQKGGFDRLDREIKKFRVRGMPDLVFNLERFVDKIKNEISGKTVHVFRIGPGQFQYHDELMKRMKELNVDWKETLVDVGDVDNPYVGSPAITAAWNEVVQSGNLPDIIWEEGGRLESSTTTDSACIRTRNSNILYYMNGVTMFSPKTSTAHTIVKKLMVAFDDIPRHISEWENKYPTAVVEDFETRESLRQNFISAAVSLTTGNFESFALLCHSKSLYHKDIHSAQFKKNNDVIVRAFPVCTWASNAVAIVTGIVSTDSEDSFGNQDMLSFWMVEDGVWKLLVMTDDPCNTKVSAIEMLGNWAVEHLAPFQGDSIQSDLPPDFVASKPQIEDTGGRFNNWTWKAASEDNRKSFPYVQIVEFHYGASARLFFNDSSDCLVSEGELWTTNDLWTVRVWSLAKGNITFGEGTDFNH